MMICKVMKQEIKSFSFIINRLQRSDIKRQNTRVETINLTHHFLGQGSASTTSLSFGRGGFLGVRPRDRPGDGHGLGLDDCGLSGVEGGMFGGSSSSSSDDV